MPEETPSWLLGTGLDTDMKGDYRAGGGGNRFWMPKGTSRKIIFLTEGDKAPVLWEHQIKLGGSFRNWFTCLRPLGVPCPLCAWATGHNNQGARYKGAFFTVIDTHEFTDKSGKKRSNEKKLLVAKENVAEKMKRKFLRLNEEGQGLRGAMFEVFRTSSDKSPSVGEDFEYIKHIDMSAVPDPKEFDYASILKPDPEKVKQVLEALKMGGGTWAGSDDDDEPASSGSKEEGSSTAVRY